MKKNTLVGADVLESSKFFIDEFHDTGIPALNIAMSAQVDGGYSAGSTLISGFSATFKSLFMMGLGKAHLTNFDDSIMIYYDIEFGTNKSAMDFMGLDTSRIIHKPFSTIEDLTHDMVVMLDELTEDDNVVFCIDSLGAANTKKSIADSIDGKNTTDLTEAKMLRKFWSLVNPVLNIKKFPMFAIGQLYDSHDRYSPAVVRGGHAQKYFPNNRWIITKSQEKDGTEFVGNKFTITVEKSRRTKERSKFPITVTFDKGIDKYSALLDIALETGHVIKPKVGWFSKDGGESNLRRKQTSTPEFWNSILEDESFKEAVHKMYILGGTIGTSEENMDEVGEEETPKKKTRVYKVGKKKAKNTDDGEIDLDDLR